MISKRKEKKKVFTEIARDFPAVIGNSSVFSGRKQVFSKKKKSLYPKNVMKSGVSPQKTPIWASICTPVAPSLIISSGHSPRLGGAQFSFGGAQAVIWGGARPRYAPRGAGSDLILTEKPPHSDSRLIKIWVKFVYCCFQLSTPPGNATRLRESTRFLTFESQLKKLSCSVLLLLAIQVQNTFKIVHFVFFL